MWRNDFEQLYTYLHIGIKNVVKENGQVVPRLTNTILRRKKNSRRENRSDTKV